MKGSACCVHRFVGRSLFILLQGIKPQDLATARGSLKPWWPLGGLERTGSNQWRNRACGQSTSFTKLPATHNTQPPAKTAPLNKHLLTAQQKCSIQQEVWVGQKCTFRASFASFNCLKTTSNRSGLTLRHVLRCVSYGSSTAIGWSGDVHSLNKANCFQRRGLKRVKLPH